MKSLFGRVVYLDDGLSDTLGENATMGKMGGCLASPTLRFSYGVAKA